MLSDSLQLNLVSNMTWLRPDNNETSFFRTLMCSGEIKFTNVTNITIRGLKLTSLRASFEVVTPLFSAILSWDVVLSNCNFLNLRIGSLVSSLNSNVTITNCSLLGHPSNKGSAIIAMQNSNLNLTWNNIDNFSIFGGICVEDSNILLSYNTITNNSAFNTGGAINCHRCSMMMSQYNYFGNNYLRSNSSQAMGGAITVTEGSILVKGSVIFYNNTAWKGGAVALVNTKAEFRWTCYLHR